MNTNHKTAGGEMDGLAELMLLMGASGVVVAAFIGYAAYRAHKTGTLGALSPADRHELLKELRRQERLLEQDPSRWRGPLQQIKREIGALQAEGGINFSCATGINVFSGDRHLRHELSDPAYQLQIYIDNNNNEVERFGGRSWPALYRMREDVMNDLARRFVRGTYVPATAPAAFMPLVNLAADRFNAEARLRRWDPMYFSPEDRADLARYYADVFDVAVESGEILPDVSGTSSGSMNALAEMTR